MKRFLDELSALLRRDDVRVGYQCYIAPDSSPFQVGCRSWTPQNNLAALVPMPGRFSLSDGHEIVEQQERIEMVRPGKAPGITACGRWP